MMNEQLVKSEDGRNLSRAGLQGLCHDLCRPYGTRSHLPLYPALDHPNPRKSGAGLGTPVKRWAKLFRPIRGWFCVLLSALVLLLTFTACSGEKPTTTRAPEIVRDVTLFTAQRTTVPDFTEATGTVRASQSAQLSSQVMGTITRVNVHEGDRVQRGEVLIAIDEAQQRAAYSGANAGLQASQENIAAADADYGLAESTMKRYQMLYDKKSVSPQEFDEVKTKLAAAKARRDAAHAGRTQAEAGVSQASTAMGFTKIRAPFNGLVTAKLADAGAIATPGVPLLIVEDAGHFRLEATLDESKMGAVRLGETVPVVVDALGDQTITGKIVQIVPAADPASHTFTVKIDLPVNSQIRSGLFGRARFARGERRSILVPQTALLHRGQLDTVYVVGKDQLASLRYVTLGTPSAQQVEVLSGLEAGDQVVAQPGGRELSGKQIGAQ
ncbi:MAG: efflux RND transporter periplasmic adaptor subunit [Candidatus Korobacteraceae bacterium]|jgi:RND family efflux transporter MFP subunit